MKQKIRAVVLICVIAMLSICSVFTLSGCDKNDEPRDVELEVINPNTGEVLKSGDHIVYPGKNALIEVRIKDKETGVYLTDDDFPDNTVRGCLTFYVNRLRSDGSVESHLSSMGECYYDVFGKFHAAPKGVWPQNEEYKSNYYEVSIAFDCKPKNIQQDNFKRKYNTLAIGPDWNFYID